MRTGRDGGNRSVTHVAGPLCQGSCRPHPKLPWGGTENMMTRPYSPTFKAKMVQRMMGREALSAHRLAQESGVRQQTLSRWLREARMLGVMMDDPANKPGGGARSVDDKLRILMAAIRLSGEELGAFLRQEGLHMARLDEWRKALDDHAQPSTSARRRIRELERELRRKDKALAEAAALLILKKKLRVFSEDEDDDTSPTDDG